MPLDPAVIAPGDTVRLPIRPPVQLGNRGGLLTLLDAGGLKVDGVAHTEVDAGLEGHSSFSSEVENPEPGCSHPVRQCKECPMTLLRAAARTMLASYFVASGIRAVRNPDPLVPAAEPVVDKIVPLAKQYAPDQIASRIPEDTATLVRVDGALQIVGGLALATGKGRRLGAYLLAGSLVPNTIAKHPFWSRTDPEERADDRNAFLKNVSLLGA